MRFESLLRGLLVSISSLYSFSSFAIEVVNDYEDRAQAIEKSIPSYVDGATVQEACDRVVLDYDYVEWEKKNTVPTYTERVRICVAQTNAMVFAFDRNTKICGLMSEACFQTARRLGSNPLMVKSCHEAAADAQETIEKSEKGIAELRKTNRSCKRTFAQLCETEQDSTHCADGAWKTARTKPAPKASRKKSLAERVDKLQERAVRLEENAKAAQGIVYLVREGKELLADKPATTSGDTNIQQSYGSAEAYRQYQESRTAATSDTSLGAPESSESPPLPATPSREAARTDDEGSPGAKSVPRSGLSLESLKSFGEGVQKVVTNPEVLATTGLLRNQYLNKKAAKKSQFERQQALDQANAANSRNEVQNNLLKIKEDKSASGGGSRPESNGLTAVGKGAPVVASISPELSALNPQGNPSKDFSPASAGPQGAGSAKAGDAKGPRGTAAVTGSSQTGASAASAAGGASGTSSSPDQNLEKYTEDRGFYGALARAFGFKNKKAKPTKATGSASGGQRAVAAPQTANATQTLSKRWNQTLGRVREMGVSRGLASEENKDEGITEKHRSIFGSICNRYSTFRKESQLGAGRAVCPGN